MAPAQDRSARAARFRQLVLALVLVLAGAAALFAPGRSAAEAAPAALLLDPARGSIDAWPAVTVRSAPGRALSAQQVLDQPQALQRPRTAHATLGMRQDAVWLHLPLVAAPGDDGHWVLDIDYPVLQRIEVYQAGADGRPVLRGVLGNSLPYAHRPLLARGHALPLQLAAGAPQQLLLRVESAGTMILPITLNKPAAFHQRAIDEQMLQGVLTGLALCLLIYSLGQWLNLGEPLFAKYALMISGSLLFSLLMFGVGSQYLWTDRLWVEEHAGGLSALIASCGSFLFIEQALAGPGTRRWFSVTMKTGAALSALFAVAYGSGAIGVEGVTGVVSVLGLLPALMGVSGAIGRARRGDTVGGYFLVAWAVYFVSTAVAIGVIKGQIGADFWTLHAFQFGATVDMLVFMRVLGLRTRELRLAAQHVAQERDAMRSLALTDPLTGLTNRRGMDTLLEAAVAQPAAGQLLALYVLDLDGFKPVNDRWGHDVGDELLIAVARRLQAQVRLSDLVARLGGDEFVVMAGGLHNEQQAHDLGLKLLEAFSPPFELSRQACSVGLTIGYALAPLDAADAGALLKRADAAMYAGKQAGKNCLRRATAAHGAALRDAPVVS